MKKYFTRRTGFVVISVKSETLFLTARNALFPHFAMVYFWGIGIASYVLENPTSFLVMAAIGGIVNFWSHTHYNLPQGSVLAKILGSIFVLEQ